MRASRSANCLAADLICYLRLLRSALCEVVKGGSLGLGTTIPESSTWTWWSTLKVYIIIRIQQLAFKLAYKALLKLLSEVPS